MRLCRSTIFEYHLTPFCSPSSVAPFMREAMLSFEFTPDSFIHKVQKRLMLKMPPYFAVPETVTAGAAHRQGSSRCTRFVSSRPVGWLQARRRRAQQKDIAP